MARVKDLTGVTFNNLLVKKCVGRDKWGQSLWECECSCKDHSTVTVRAGDLKSGRVKSCGCLTIQHAKEQAKKNKNQNKFVIEGNISKMYDIRGNYTLIDTEDIDRLSKFCWYKHTNGYWASYSPKFITLHRFIMNFPKGKVVDHIHFNLNDHRKSQLKVCSIAENNQNNRARKTKTDKDLPVGVTRTKSGRFRSYICRDGIVHQKTFDTVEECVDYRNQFI